MLSRLVKAEEGHSKILGSKDLMLKLIVYYTFEDYNKSALITLHTLMSKPDFRTVCLETHQFTLASFMPFVNSSKANYKRYLESENWDEYQNCCTSISGFVG